MGTTFQGNDKTVNHDFLHIAVLMGGPSAEQQISVLSGKEVTRALQTLGHHVTPVIVQDDPARELAQGLPAHVDLVFNVVHGQWGEDGEAQKLLESLSVPYTGSGVWASQVAMDKIASKKIFDAHNIPTPRYRIITRENQRDLLPALEHDLGYPLFVKPPSQGSSVGSGIARSQPELESKLDAAWKHGPRALVECFVPGTELTVAVLDGEALGSAEIVPLHGFYDFENKYDRDRTHYHVPPRISEPRLRGVLALGESVARAIHVQGLCRVDLMLSSHANEQVLEVNTIPGLTQGSLVPRIAKAHGLSFENLCERMVLAAAKSYGLRCNTHTA